jgi:hypothetical protein
MSDEEIFEQFWRQELLPIIPEESHRRAKILARACFNAGRSFERRLRPSIISRFLSLFSQSKP